MIAPANNASAAAPLLATLAPAERLVAVHVVQGLANKEIAALLGKSEPTVKHQVSSILDKTGAYSRCRFIAHYYQQFFCLLPRTPACICRTDRDSAASAFALAELRRDKKNPPPDSPACHVGPKLRAKADANLQLSSGGTSSRPKVRQVA